MPKFLAICLSSTIQKTINFQNIEFSNVNRSKSYRLDASGKALNSARVLNQLQDECCVCVCPVGKKNAGIFFELAKRDNLKLKTVKISGFTRECLTLLDNSKNSTTELVVSEPVLQKSFKNEEKKLLSIIKNQIQNADGILLAGSRPEIWSENLTEKISEIAFESKKIYLADFCGKDLLNTLKICVPSIIKINEDEFRSTFDFKENNSEDLKNAIKQKSQEFQNMIVVTRGKNETFAAKNGEFFVCPTENILKIVNTTACGDSFNAGFLYEYVKTKDFEKALKKGTWCAAKNAQSEIPGSIDF